MNRKRKGQNKLHLYWTAKINAGCMAVLLKCTSTWYCWLLVTNLLFYELMNCVEDVTIRKNCIKDVTIHIIKKIVSCNVYVHATSQSIWAPTELRVAQHMRSWIHAVLVYTRKWTPLFKNTRGKRTLFSIFRKYLRITRTLKCVIDTIIGG